MDVPSNPEDSYPFSFQEEAQRQIVQSLYRQQKAADNQIRGSKIFGELLSKAQGSGRREHQSFEDETQDVPISPENGSLVVDPNGHYYYDFYTPSIVDPLTRGADKPLDEWDYSMVEFKHIIEQTELENGLGISVGAGTEIVTVHALADEKVKKIIEEELDPEEPGAMIAELNTSYYVTEQGDVKKVLNIPIDIFELDVYRDLEKKLLKSDLKLIRVPRKGWTRIPAEYFCVSEMTDEDYELLALATNLIRQKTQENIK